MRIVDITADEVTASLVMMQRRGTPLRFLLVPMWHAASPSFYGEVRCQLATCDLIIAEGTRGPSWELSALTLTYRLSARFRRSLRLQDYATLLPPWVPAFFVDLTSREVASALKRLPRWVYLLVLALAPLAGLVFALWGPRMYFGKLGKHLTVDLSTALWLPQLRADVELDKMLRAGTAVGDPWTACNRRREALVLEALSAIHERGRHEPRTVAVVYGAAHIPIIAKGLMIRHGYRPHQVERLVVLERHPSSLHAPMRADPRP